MISALKTKSLSDSRNFDGVKQFAVPNASGITQLVAEAEYPTSEIACITVYDADRGSGLPPVACTIAAIIEFGSRGGVGAVAAFSASHGMIINLPGSWFRVSLVFGNNSGGPVVRNLGVIISQGARPGPIEIPHQSAIAVAAGAVSAAYAVMHFSTAIRVLTTQGPFQIEFLNSAAVPGIINPVCVVGGNDSGWINVPAEAHQYRVRNTGGVNLTFASHYRY